MKRLLTTIYACDCGAEISVYKGTYMINHKCKKCGHKVYVKQD